MRRAERLAQVAMLLEEGYTDEEMADELGLSVAYVEQLRAVGRPPRRRWTREECADAVVSWALEHDRLPLTSDFAVRERRGEGRPSTAPIYRLLGVAPGRPERELAAIRREIRELEADIEADPRPGAAWDWRHSRVTSWKRELERGFESRPRWADVLANVADRLPAHLVASHRNALVRSELMEAAGVDRVMTEVGERLQSDDWGTLWRIEFPRHVTRAGERVLAERDEWDEPLVVVQVVNSTPEPDGSFRDYFLRVPPDTATARAGVAWTFALTEEEYDPLVET